MREIKFRGKCSQSKRWVYGWLLTNKLGTYIVTEENPHECTQNHYIEIDEYCRVVPESVGQFTGLHDKNGKEIYEGDIVDVNYTVKYIDPDKQDEEEFHKFANDDLYRFVRDKYAEVIGNIYENPELLELIE